MSVGAQARGLISAQHAVDVGRGQLPVVLEVGDDLAHEAVLQRRSFLVVTEMIDKKGEGELRRRRAFIAPFEPTGRIAMALHLIVERLAIDGHDNPIDGAVAGISLHCGFFPSPWRRMTSGKTQRLAIMKGPRKATAPCGPGSPRW